MNSSCDKFRDKIADRLNGTLPEDQKEALELHIAGCEDCAEYETKLRAEDQALAESFSRFEKDIDEGQQEIIRAIRYLKTSPGERAISYITAFINNPYVKIVAAAAVIALVTINYIKVMGWLYDVKHFMEICSITVK